MLKLSMTIILLIYIFSIFFIIIRYNFSDSFKSSKLADISREKSRPSYIEKLTFRIGMVATIIAVVMSLFSIITFALNEGVQGIAPEFLWFPAMILAVWYSLYKNSRGTYIAENGIIAGVKLYRWKGIKDYQIIEWQDKRKKNTKSYLKFKKMLFPVYIEIEKNNLKQVSKVLKERIRG